MNAGIGLGLIADPARGRDDGARGRGALAGWTGATTATDAPGRAAPAGQAIRGSSEFGRTATRPRASSPDGDGGDVERPRAGDGDSARGRGALAGQAGRRAPSRDVAAPAGRPTATAHGSLGERRRRPRPGRTRRVQPPVDIGSPQHLFVVLRMIEGSLAAFVACVDVRPGRDQRRDRRRRTGVLERRPMKRRRAVLVAGADIRPGRDQQHKRRGIGVVRRRPMKRRNAVRRRPRAWRARRARRRPGPELGARPGHRGASRRPCLASSGERYSLFLASGP